MTFLGIVLWAFSSKRKTAFDEAAQLPFEDEPSTTPTNLHRSKFMADFNSDFWHWYIAILTILSILACVWLLRWMTTGFKKADEVEDTGHVWDGDLTELNNPLPRWWLGLFYITIVFSGFYLLLYPGLGTYSGMLGWTSKGEYEQEVAAWKPRSAPCSNATSRPRSST